MPKWPTLRSADNAALRLGTYTSAIAAIAAAFTAAVAVVSWITHSISALAVYGWGLPVLVAIGIVLVIVLILSLAAVAWRYFKPYPVLAGQKASVIAVSPTLLTGLYVSDIRFSFAGLSERHGEWSMRVFNGTGRVVEFSGLSGRIKFNDPNNVSSRRAPGISAPLAGELPEPSARADMAQTVAPFKEWLLILSQRVPATEADTLSAMLAADTPIHFDLSGLTIKICAQDDHQKIERLPIWGGVSYKRGSGFGQIIRATARITLG